MKKVLLIVAAIAGVGLVMVVVLLILTWRPLVRFASGTMVRAGVQAVEEGRLADAMKLYDTAIEIDPTNARAFASRAYLDVEIGKKDAATSDAKQAVTLDDRAPLAWAASGYAHNANREFAPGVADYNRAIALDPRIASYYGDRGLGELGLDDLKSAKADFDREIEMRPGASAGYSLRARYDFRINDLKEGESDLGKAIAIKPNFVPYLERRGWLRLYDGRFADAADDAKRALSLRAGNPNALYVLSIAQRRLGEPESALKTLNDLLVLNPDYPGAHFDRGLDYYDLGDLKHARIDFETSARTDDVYRGVTWLWILDVDEADHAAADAQLDKIAAGTTPKDPMPAKYADMIRGRITPDEVIAQFPAALLENHRQDCECAAWFLAGKAAEAKGDQASAQADYRKAIDSGSSDLEAAEARRALDAGKGAGVSASGLMASHSKTIDVKTDTTTPETVQFMDLSKNPKGPAGNLFFNSTTGTNYPAGAAGSPAR